MKHLSLFSGIGGFDLAAQWMGWENVAQVEIDKFCLKVLEKNFPNTTRYEDIRTFPAADHIGRIDIITGGFPCQPFSQAGARRGTTDDRHLWPEMLRVLQIIKPMWVVAENVRGLLTIDDGMVFEQVCTDLENAGYEVQAFVIPACALNAPHRRERVWIVANLQSKRLREERAYCKQSKKWSTRIYPTYVADSERQGWDEGQQPKERQVARFDDKNWLQVAAEICGVDDGLPAELDGFKLSKARHRAERIKSLGNAIVPQIAYKIFNSLIQK